MIEIPKSTPHKIPSASPNLTGLSILKKLKAVKFYHRPRICENPKVKAFHIFQKTILAALVFFVAAGVAVAAQFDDVSTDHPNAAAIDYLSKEGIISGYPDGTFQPENSVNRAEALKILLLASGTPTGGKQSGNFPDVSSVDWFAPFVSAATERKITAGYPDGFFRPARTVNLVEALKMLLAANSVELENYTTDEKLFADSEKRAWYNHFLFYAKTFEIVEPDSADRIFPGKALTRGALAEIVFRFAMRVENICPQFLGNSKTFPTSYFREITLGTRLPNIFYEGEVFAVRGSTTSSDEEMTAIFENKTTKEQSRFASEISAGQFVVPTEFSQPGSYNFSVMPSSMNSNSAATITVVPRECRPDTIVGSTIAPTNLQNKLIDNQPVISWDSGDNNIFLVTIDQGENHFEKIVSGGQNSLELSPADFENFSSGSATFRVSGAQSENGWGFEPRSRWVGGSTSDLKLSQHHFSRIHDDKISLTSLPEYRAHRISLTGTAKTGLDSTAYLIAPNGAVEKIEMLESAEEIASGARFNLNLQLPVVGTYIVEINSTDGIAALNHPLYLPGEFPLIPDFADLRELKDPDFQLSLNREKSIWMRLVNDFRAQQRLPQVSLDSDLSRLAQNYAEKMAAQNFFAHVDPDGNSPDDRRKIFGLKTPVGENLARDNSTESAHAGLLRSAAHRANIITPEWTRVGLGIAEDADGNLIFVQEFSTDPLTSENSITTKNTLLDEINSARAEVGTSKLILDGQVGSATQGWSEKMIAEDFVGFTHGADSLENMIRSTGYSGGFTSFIATAGKISQIIESLNEAVLADSGVTRVAIGLAQDSDGVLFATLVFR